MRRAPARALLVALLLGLPACGLPVERGVRAPGPVPADEVAAGQLEVLPPGPVAGAGPREIVLGFLAAQVSDEDDHAVARQFLAPPLTEEWDDESGVLIYDDAPVEVRPDPDDPTLVVVRSDAVARIGTDGAYVLDSRPVEDVYRLTRLENGELRLSAVPAGLRLTPRDARLGFEPHDVYFLRPSGTPEPADQLVPDRVFLPAADRQGELAAALVRRLLAGPSSGLAGAVTSAVPEGTELRSPVTVTEGVVTVDLGGELLTRGATDPATRRQLAAQLVWTLLEAVPGASGVRVLVDGRPFDVPDADEVQDRSDLRAFDPVGPAGRAAALYVADRTLHRLDGPATRSPATDGTLPVDAVAVSPSTGRLAVLTRDDAGPDVVRVGPAAGPFEPVLTVPAVLSMSWGSGDRGLWVVSDPGGGAEPRLQLVPTAPGAVVDVGYNRPPGAGPLHLLRVSRDGARVAAVFGRGADRRLYTGRAAVIEEALLVDGLRAVAPALTDVADVAWQSGTSLVVLGRFQTANRLPVRVAVDGSEVEPVRTLGLDGEAATLAAAPGRPLVVGAVRDGRPELLVEDGGLFRLQTAGTAPAYPG